jgi:hypothetical protein
LITRQECIIPYTKLGLITVSSSGIPENTVEEAERVVGLPGGPRRSRSRKVRGEIKASGKTLNIDPDQESMSEKKEKETLHIREELMSFEHVQANCT